MSSATRLVVAINFKSKIASLPLSQLLVGSKDFSLRVFSAGGDTVHDFRELEV